jgi:hypothetical protein
MNKKVNYIVTPEELYKISLNSDIEPIYDLSYLAPEGSYFNHIRELDPELIRSTGDELTHTTRNHYVKIYLLKNFNFDGRRFWRLGTVFFMDNPVMIIQNAGREGDDHRQVYITNFGTYRDMVEYIYRISRPKRPEFYEQNDEYRSIVKSDENIADLIEFYGNKLGGYFEPY